MKRNMDFIRELLLLIESSEEKINTKSPSVNELKTKYEISDKNLDHHITILYKAKIVYVKSIGGRRRQFNELTWEGHEFLDSIKDKTIWEKVKKEISEEKLTSMPMELIKQAALHYLIK